MNSIWVVFAIVIWLVLGYTIYGRFLERKFRINDKNKTPSKKNKSNKVDYSPSTKPFLVGHHFAAIAGAGPIIGPILAVSYFGWLPVVLWVAIGSVFIGAMHDYATLIVSVRNKGKGISKITSEIFGGKSGWVFGLMILFTLILLITVFSVSAAESIVEKPDLVIPIVSISILAFILGFAVRKTKIDYRILSLIALIFVFFFVWVGFQFPIKLPFDGVLERNIWVSLILVYAALVSIIPVSVFLRPRDYLSALQMVFIMIIGILSLIIFRPEISAPIYRSSSFALWPILFITVACGAVSGFHGLVSSGTTSKQLSKESHGKSVGYGAMLMEGALAVFVTLVVIAGVSWSGENSFSVTLEKGWIVLFSTGFGNIVNSALSFIPVGVAALLGAFMVNQFILTTVDSSTRIGRFVISETLFSKLKNRFFTTMLVLIPSWIIAITNSYETLWRLFGSSNQLIASISLITVSAYFTSKKIKTKFIIFPALFVLVTTMSALMYLTFRNGGYITEGKFVLAAISLAMFVLGAVVAWEGFGKLRKD